ncbi:DUF1516 family protein [Listeria sp. PSOL-1]|uniref:DUF1516 family protein n=1 Tax=Listeria sp. PSOL-1 TaxID=1844999 RepID=UPI0013D8C0A2
MWAYFHLFSWLGILILTITAWGIYAKSIKGFKVLQMIDRVFYLFIIFSGIMMLGNSFATNWVLAILKILLGIIVIGIVEMLLSFRQQQKPTMPFLILFFILLLLTILLGFYLSGGYPVFD